MKNILVSIDFEKEAGILVQRAIELAEKFGSKLWLIHISSPDPDFVDPESEVVAAGDIISNDLNDLNAMLDMYAGEIEKTGVAVGKILIEGSTVATIVDTIRKLDIDLLIIGHHKRNYFYKAFVGNTDIALINQLNIPVLTVPLKNDDSVHPRFESMHTETVKRITTILRR